MTCALGESTLIQNTTGAKGFQGVSRSFKGVQAGPKDVSTVSPKFWHSLPLKGIHFNAKCDIINHFFRFFITYSINILVFSLQSFCGLLEITSSNMAISSHSLWSTIKLAVHLPYWPFALKKNTLLRRTPTKTCERCLRYENLFCEMVQIHFIPQKVARLKVVKLGEVYYTGHISQVTSTGQCVADI